MRLIDANVVLRFLVDNDTPQGRAAQRLFQQIEQGDAQALLPECIVFEIVYVLEKYYAIPRDRIAAILSTLLAAPNLTVPDAPALLLALVTYGSTRFDLADCYLSALVSLGHAEGVYSFDRDFDRLGVPRFPLQS